MSKEQAVERENSKFIDNRTTSEISEAIDKLSDSMKIMDIKLQELEAEIKETLNGKPKV